MARRGLWSAARGMSSRRRPAGAWAVLVLAGIGVLSVVLPVFSEEPPAQPISVPAAPMPPPLAGGPAPDLDLLFTAQVVGWIEPCG